MSTYVMADIHGCYKAMMDMLAEINFSQNDRLILAGDYIDRGLQNYEMLRWIETHPNNVICLRGNHDEEFAYNIDLLKILFNKNPWLKDSYTDTCLAYEGMKRLSEESGEHVGAFDYYGTIAKLIYENQICMEQLEKWSECIREMPTVFREVINGKECIVVHAGYIDSVDGIETDELYESEEEFYLNARDDAYILGGLKNGMVVAGHTPTIFPEELPYNAGKVYRMHDEELDCIFYNIDCGISYGTVCQEAQLACLRLEDEEVFYIREKAEKTENKWIDGMTGLLVGDALGVPVQFLRREEIANRPQGPVKGMESGGVFDMPAGTWSDDGSMALASMDSIINKGNVEPEDIMKNFVEWELRGKYTQYGKAFDQGNTCTQAIYNYIKNHDITTCGVTGEYANGNGALMRILPVCIYYALQKGISEKEIIESIHTASGITHNHLRSKMACDLYYFMVKELIDSEKAKSLKKTLQSGIDKGLKYYGQNQPNLEEMLHFKRVFYLDILEQVTASEISTSGYVIDTFEAVVWGLVTTKSFEECLLKLVNLGDDSDTVAAIAGGFAGIYYGKEGIPKDWLETVKGLGEVEKMCEGMEKVML